MRRILFVILLLTLATSGWSFYNPDNNSDKSENLPVQIIVKLKSDNSIPKITPQKGSSISGIAEIDAINTKYNIRRITPLLLSGTATPASRLFEQVVVLTAENETDLDRIIADYKKLAIVEYAEPDYPVSLHDIPNDSLYQYLWSYNNTGQEHHYVKRNYGNSNDEQLLIPGLPDADIDAHEVYENPSDNTTTVVVAIVDTGVDMDHPDLIDNIWTNLREIPDNGLDDDHNGFIDDIHGWDFAASIDATDPGNNDPTDNFGHGTHVAGTIAALTDNNIGIAGLATDCKIMALSFDPLPLTSRIVNCIIYAADNGADVINMSFGLNYRSDLLKEAIEYAFSKGVIMCASSGNDGSEAYNYPAGYPETITIGSSSDSDYVSTFSTYGDHIELIAPGEAILSLRADLTDMYGGSYPYESGVHIVDEHYYISSGTSMSCPHAVAVAAQMRSISPGLTPTETRNILIATADDIVDPYGVDWNLPGWDRYSGHGRLNYFQAINNLPDVRAHITGPGQFEIVGGMIDITGTADGGAFASYSLAYGEGDLPHSWQNISQSDMPVTDDILGTWNSLNLNGKYTLRLACGAYNIAYKTIYLANRTTAGILFPLDGDTVSNFVSVLGNAYAPDFGSFILEYQNVSDSTAWTEINSGTVPHFDEKVGGWFLEGLDEDHYRLRLSLIKDDSSTVADTVAVYVRSIFDSEHAWKNQLNAYPTIIPSYGDFDGDGLNEIVFNHSAGIQFFNTDGTEKTVGVPSFPPNNYMIPVAVGHLDDDGIEDIVAVGYNPPKLYGFPSDGLPFEYYLGEFPDISNFFMTENDFPKVSLRDIDSDGIDEIYFFHYNRDVPSVSLFKSYGTLVHKFDYLSDFVSVDLDGDNNDEIYACNRFFCLLKQIDPYSGITKDSLLITENGSSFRVGGITAFDIDNDLKQELLVFGHYPDFGYYIYAFEEGLNLIEGWPHQMNIDDYVVPTVPVFGDIDNDHVPEYLTTYFDITASYILAWHLDGSPVIPGNEDGHFVVTPEPAVMNMLLLADIDGNGRTDIIACAENDLFNTYKAQRIYAWDTEAKQISGFPIITVQNKFTNERFTPSLGDIDKDGSIDMIMTTPDSGGIFINFSDITYDSCLAPAAHWRYNRRLNGIGRQTCYATPTDISDTDEQILPEKFMVAQNYPNPFNGVTQISFSLPHKANVRLEIFNLLGRKVKVLTDEEFSAGRFSVNWDGTDQDGTAVASGIYFYTLSTDQFSKTSKMIYLK